MSEVATKPETMPRTETRIQLKVDADLLLEAQRQIAAPTPDAAVHEALQRLVDQERAKRRAAGKAIDKMVERGELDFSAFDEADQ